MFEAIVNRKRGVVVKDQISEVRRRRRKKTKRRMKEESSLNSKLKTVILLTNEVGELGRKLRLLWL